MQQWLWSLLAGTFYSFIGSRALSRSNDGSATTSFAMPFYGRQERVVRVRICIYFLWKTGLYTAVNIISIQIYNNGYLTLRGSGGSSTPRPFTRGNPMIAPYWADVDTRSGPGRVYYGATTNANLLKRAKYEVEATQRRTFNPTRLFVATYNNVGYYNRHYNLVSIQ